MHSLDLLQVVVGVLIGHVGGADVQLEVGSKVLKVVVVWELCRVDLHRLYILLSDLDIYLLMQISLSLLT